jgi:beta-galactosidase
VEQGGTLISEGLPAYFGDEGRAGQTQPNYGLDEFFGVRERYVEFTPDLLEKLSLRVRGKEIYGRYFLQEYETSSGRAAGQYANGHIAAVENRYGKGRTLLIGTFPGGGYYLHHSPEARSFFAGLLQLAEVEPRLRTDNAAVQARLHSGKGGSYLWVVNPSRTEAKTTISLDAGTKFQSAQDLWGNRPVTTGVRSISVTVPARDAAVVALR